MKSRDFRSAYSGIRERISFHWKGRGGFGLEQGLREKGLLPKFDLQSGRGGTCIRGNRAKAHDKRRAKTASPRDHIIYGFRCQFRTRGNKFLARLGPQKIRGLGRFARLGASALRNDKERTIADITEKKETSFLRSRGEKGKVLRGGEKKRG